MGLVWLVAILISHSLAAPSMMNRFAVLWQFNRRRYRSLLEALHLQESDMSAAVGAAEATAAAAGAAGAAAAALSAGVAPAKQSRRAAGTSQDLPGSAPELPAASGDGCVLARSRERVLLTCRPCSVLPPRLFFRFKVAYADAMAYRWWCCHGPSVAHVYLWLLLMMLWRGRWWWRWLRWWCRSWSWSWGGAGNGGGGGGDAGGGGGGGGLVALLLWASLAHRTVVDMGGPPRRGTVLSIVSDLGNFADSRTSWKARAHALASLEELLRECPLRGAAFGSVGVVVVGVLELIAATAFPFVVRSPDDRAWLWPRQRLTRIMPLRRLRVRSRLTPCDPPPLSSSLTVDVQRSKLNVDPNDTLLRLLRSLAELLEKDNNMQNRVRLTDTFADAARQSAIAIVKTTPMTTTTGFGGFFAGCAFCCCWFAQVKAISMLRLVGLLIKPECFEPPTTEYMTACVSHSPISPVVQQQLLQQLLLHTYTHPYHAGFSCSRRTFPLVFACADWFFENLVAGKLSRKSGDRKHEEVQATMVAATQT
jgi:hypothetical protein